MARSVGFDRQTHYATSMDDLIASELDMFSIKLRKLILELTSIHQNAHLGSCLSVIEILSVLFKLQLKNFTPVDYGATSDQFILSKGHAAVALYSALLETGFISQSNFDSFCQPGSNFEEHPNFHIPTVLCTTGSLGHGLPFANGLALANKYRNYNNKIFILMSDGECNEGTVWEAAQFAYSKKLSNIIVLIDHNKLQATGSIEESIGNLSLAKMFGSFGWKTFEIDGHNLDQINTSIQESRDSNTPSAIICHTVKGKGISFMESDNNWHYRAPNENELRAALREIGA